MNLTAFDPGAAREARRVLEYNPYHGPDGKFATKGAAKTTVAYSGRKPKHMAAAVNRHLGGGVSPREKQAFAAMTDKQQTHSHRAATIAGRRYLAASSRAAARQSVPQNPGKYTRPVSDGQAPRGVENLKANRKWEAGVGMGPTTRTSQELHGDVNARTPAARKAAMHKRAAGNLRMARTRDEPDTRDAALRAGRRQRWEAAKGPEWEPKVDLSNKYVKPLRHGKPSRDMNDVLAQRRSEDSIPRYASRREIERNHQVQRDARGGDYTKTTSARAARAASLYWHDRAADTYGDVRRARQEGRAGGFTSTRSTADSNRRAAKQAASRAAQLAKKR